MLTADVMVKSYAERGYIQRVLAGWTGRAAELNAVFPRGQGKSPKVRAFVDFLVERMNFDADFMEGLCPNRKCGEADLDLGALSQDGAAVEDTAFGEGVAA
jgi:hypothetical protein